MLDPFYICNSIVLWKIAVCKFLFQFPLICIIIGWGFHYSIINFWKEPLHNESMVNINCLNSIKFFIISEPLCTAICRYWKKKGFLVFNLSLHYKLQTPVKQSANLIRIACSCSLKVTHYFSCRTLLIINYFLFPPGKNQPQIDRSHE